MKCKSPMLVHYTTDKNGKRKMKFGSQAGEYSVKLPCGKCIACKVNYSIDWGIRMQIEASKYAFNEFITLTYDNDHCPNELDKKAITKFMKKLRKIYGENIKFFGCGEYGSQKGRPHYHIAIFNIMITDKKLHSFSKHKYPLYYSKQISDIWGKGRVLINDLTWQSSLYIARYITKKHYQKDFDKQREYTRMSTNKAIGWLPPDKIWKMYETDRIFYTTNNGVKSKTPPRYYEKQLEKYYPERHKQLQIERDIKNKNNQKYIDQDELLMEHLISVNETRTNYDVQFDNIARSLATLQRNLE